jgi:nucleotide-binding universal stress UspA family protein
VSEPEPELLQIDPTDRLYGPNGDIRAYLDSVLGPAGGKGVAVAGVPVFDPLGPAEGVHAYLEDSPAALVVAGAHHRNRNSRASLSNTPAAIVRRSPSPVLVLP